ncbi:MAG TPA: sialidase family protein [Pyrinomonadaceae bacterium]|nr:sialidase family protein [Pyrinomonadaceae bacterium]
MKRLFCITSLLLALSVAATTAAAQQAGAIRPSPLRVSGEGMDAAEPAIAAAKDGSVFVVWVGHAADGAADVWLAHFAADGRRLGVTPTRVNPKAGQATAWRGDAPTVAVAPDGRSVYVGWMAVGKAVSASPGESAALHVSTSRDGGRTFAPPVKVRDDPKPAAHGMHSLTVAEDGRIHIAWLDERGLVPPHAHTDAKAKTSGHHMEANRQVFTAYSTDGGRTFSPNRLVARDACPCCKTSLAASKDGRVYVSWRQVLAGDFRHIAVAASPDKGQTFAAPVVVSDDRWMLNGCPVSGASLALGGGGDVLNVVWYTAGEAGAPGIYWSESRDGGQTFAARRAVAQGKAQGTPTLLIPDDGAAFVVWDSRASGSARPTSARIERGGERASSVNPLAPGGELPSATIAGDGRLFVAYVSKRGDRRAVSLLHTGVRDAGASPEASQTPGKNSRRASN